MDDEIKVYKNVFIALLVATVAFVIYATVDESIREKKRYEEYRQLRRQWEIRDSIAAAKVRKEDSIINPFIMQRAQEKLNSSIFAGLHFGDSPLTVRNALDNNNNRTILVPEGGQVKNVYIKDYEAQFYKDGLASLTLFAEEDELFTPLSVLFTTKYGKTKNSKWTFADCEIEIDVAGRIEYNPSKEAGYGGSTNIYYDSFRKSRTDRIAKDGSFLKISYKKFSLLQLIEREKNVADSLENVKRLKAIEKEKELARKLATEPATNI